MSYANQAALAADPDFHARVVACSKEQALTFKDDPDRSIAALATAVIQSPSNADGIFELVCVAPNFREVTSGADATDLDILAAVQAAWPVYGEAFYPA